MVETVNLNPFDTKKRLAKEYLHGEYEQVTVMDVAPSLASMVTTGIVGSLSGNDRYVYPDIGETDDEGHEHPDYQQVNKLDVFEKNQFAEEWIKNPKFYEKVNKPEKGSDGNEPKEGGEAKGEPT